MNSRVLIPLHPSNAKATFVQSIRAQRFLKPSNPCHVGIHWIVHAEYSQMSTHKPGFQSFFWVFRIIFYWQNLRPAACRLRNDPCIFHENGGIERSEYFNSVFKLC